MGLVMGDYTKIKPAVIHKVCDTIASTGVAVSCNVYQPESSDPAQLPGTSVLPLTDSSGQIRVWNKETATDLAGPVQKTNTWFVVPEIHITSASASRQCRATW
jgi:hypothetical protein